MSKQPVVTNGSTPHELSKANFVILANKPRMLRQMLRRAIKDTPDLQVVAEIWDLTMLSNASLPGKMGWRNIHWLVVTLSENSRIPYLVRALQGEYPSLSVLAVSMDGSQIKTRVPVEGMAGSFRTFALKNVSLKKLISILQHRSTELSPGRFFDRLADGEVRFPEDRLG
jgi:hypothetical protein